MEAVGAAASVLAVIELVGRISISARSLMREVRGARKDMIDVRKDLSDLSTVLNMLAEDLDLDNGRPDATRGGHHHIASIANSCRTVLSEIEAVLRESRSRLVWAASGRERVDRLRTRLETCTLSLDVALDYRTMVVVHDIKEDSTRIVGDLSTIRRDMALLLGKIDNIEQKASAGPGPPDATELSGDNVVLDRFLDDCRSDAQTVLDSIDYQQEHVFDNIPSQLSETTEHAESVPNLTTSSSLPAILFSNSLGHVHEIPLEECGTWTEMAETVMNTYPCDSVDFEEIQAGRFFLVHDGQWIPWESWDHVVGPGLRVGMRLWRNDVIRFRDAVGRKTKIPWYMITKWSAIEKRIRNKFVHFESLRRSVQKGRYDLLGPDNTVILPETWESVVRPGMSITMKMWPNAEVSHGVSPSTPPHQPPEQRPPGAPGVGRPPRPPRPIHPPASKPTKTSHRPRNYRYEPSLFVKIFSLQTHVAM
ncbi:hypothetical protein N8I77_007178 [Diaporthe amygdali]|uniref:Ubiquitin-like domain-containing protein n=1 Tax=Phomopsis amygdali TaxID=1214568 RepID=A0AAD9SBI3_PHOAM|nr:hypothetical protein N8I77_007178 [Diaporthe amygdali]